jgi:hypothetical protein
LDEENQEIPNETHTLLGDTIVLLDNPRCNRGLWGYLRKIIHGKEVANLSVYLIADNNVHIRYVTTMIL